MTQKDFTALADMIRWHNQTKRAVHRVHAERMCFSLETIYALAEFCSRQNPRFNRGPWLAYIVRECEPNGGKT